MCFGRVFGGVGEHAFLETPLSITGTASDAGVLYRTMTTNSRCAFSLQYPVCVSERDRDMSSASTIKEMQISNLNLILFGLCLIMKLYCLPTIQLPLIIRNAFFERASRLSPDFGAVKEC